MIETTKIPSKALKDHIFLKVITPDKQPVERLMILLHGTMNPESSLDLFEEIPDEWDLENLCESFHLAIAVPLMKNRYYISVKDYDCEEFIAYELVKYLKLRCEIPHSAEMILAGVSMGGYGAVLIGARTGVFQKIISVSGSFITGDIRVGNPEVWGTLTPHSAGVENTFLYYFLPLEDLASASDRNAEAALALSDRRGEQASLVLTCGTKDWLYSRNLAFLKALDQWKTDYMFYSLENGGHDAESFKKGLWKAAEYVVNAPD